MFCCLITDQWRQIISYNNKLDRVLLLVVCRITHRCTTGSNGTCISVVPTFCLCPRCCQHTIQAVCLQMLQYQFERRLLYEPDQSADCISLFRAFMVFRVNHFHPFFFRCFRISVGVIVLNFVYPWTVFGVWTFHREVVKLSKFRALLTPCWALFPFHDVHIATEFTVEWLWSIFRLSRLTRAFVTT